MEEANTIKSIGIELEGGMSRKSLERLNQLFHTDNRYVVWADGSVAVLDKELPNLELKFWSVDVNELFTFIERCFELGFKQNHTCGNHIHYRFKDMETAIKIVTHNTFWRKFRTLYTKTFPDEKYLERLECRWSKGYYRSEDMYRVCRGYPPSDRYVAVNLASFWEPQKTIEVRILPYADSARELTSAITKLNGIMLKLLNSIEIRKKVLEARKMELLDSLEVEPLCVLQKSYTVETELEKLVTQL